MSFLSCSGYKLWYDVQGQGPCLILLHPNAMSSRLFEPILPLYTRRFQVFTLDFLGHGRSDRLAAFPTDFWQDAAAQVLTLADTLHLRDITLLGVDGGAAVALNAAMQGSGRIARVIADGFSGEAALQNPDVLRLQRAAMKFSQEGQALFSRMHGDHWEDVLDADTSMMARHAAAGASAFSAPPESLNLPVLFTAVRQDQLFPQAEESAIRFAEKLPQGRAYIFGSGRHPALLSNPEEFSEVAAAFSGL